MTNEPEKKPSKKPYRTPRLTEYGSVTKLTQGGGSLFTPDGMSSMEMKK